MNTKILIVDDEIDIVLMLRSFFESKGYLVLFATNGEEALKQIERQPNIILLEINMPAKRDSFEAQVRFSGDLTIDYLERCLFFSDKRVGLAKKEFDIVELLSQNPGQVFDKERIYERIWGYDSEGDSSVVTEHIRRIRTKIAAHTDRVYIETVWGCGYKWIK